jgi:hypothetical protein
VTRPRTPPSPEAIAQRPEYVVCALTGMYDRPEGHPQGPRREQTTWCGRKNPPEFVFTDATHALLNAKQGGRLLLCSDCAGALWMALGAGTWTPPSAPTRTPPVTPAELEAVGARFRGLLTEESGARLATPGGLSAWLEAHARGWDLHGDNPSPSLCESSHILAIALARLFRAGSPS